MEKLMVSLLLIQGWNVSIYNYTGSHFLSLQFGGLILIHKTILLVNIRVVCVPLQFGGNLSVFSYQGHHCFSFSSYVYVDFSSSRIEILYSTFHIQEVIVSVVLCIQAPLGVRAYPWIVSKYLSVCVSVCVSPTNNAVVFFSKLVESLFILVNWTILYNPTSIFLFKAHNPSTFFFNSEYVCT